MVFKDACELNSINLVPDNIRIMMICLELSILRTPTSLLPTPVACPARLYVYAFLNIFLQCYRGVGLEKLFFQFCLLLSDAELSRVQEQLHRHRTAKRKSAADIREGLI